MKLNNPYLYPVGTVVMIDDAALSLTRYSAECRRYWTVTGIVCVGPRNYTFTTNVEHTGAGMEGLFYTFNLDYVEAIISRGDGPLKIQYTPAGRDASDATVAKDIRRQECWDNRPGYVKVLALHGLMRILVAKFTNKGACVDVDGMVVDALNQTWCSKVKENNFTYWRVNKKRLHKWARANVNRYLMSMHELIKARDNDYDKFVKSDDGEDFSSRGDFGDETPVVSVYDTSWQR